MDALSHGLTRGTATPHAASGGMRGSLIVIPMLSNDRFVEVETSELPDDATDLIDILKAECARLDLWMLIALEYYRQGKAENFLLVLEDAADDEIEKLPAYRYAGVREQRQHIFLALAAYHIDMAKGEPDTSTRNHYFTTARRHVLKARDIGGGGHSDSYSDMVQVLLGLIALYTNDKNSAAQYFRLAIELDNNCFPALLGLAQIAFQQEDYKLARTYYANAIIIHPDCSASIRVGLGLCLYKLGHIEAAKKAFKRALDLDATCVPALSCLAVLELEHSNAPRATVASGVDKLAKAYQLSRTNSTVMNHLAHHLFSKWFAVGQGAVTQGSNIIQTSADFSAKFNPASPIRVGTRIMYVASVNASTIVLSSAYEGATGNVQLFNKQFSDSLRLAREALQFTDNERQKAESHYIIAKCQHASGLFAEALESYDKACHTWPNFPLAVFGRAQIYLQQGRSAHDGVEAVMQQYPDNASVRLVAADLYAHMKVPRMEDALACLKRAADVATKDAVPWIQRAVLLQQSRASDAVPKAIAAYEKAVMILVQNGSLIPAELWCNLGSLRLMAGDYEGAEKYLQQALATVAKLKNCSTEAAMYLAEGVTITYNIARSREARNMVADADILYSNILKEQPSYVDAYLRKGCIALSTGDLAAAEYWFKLPTIEGGVAPRGSGDALAMLGSVLVKRKHLKEAAELFERMKQRQSKDPYAALSLANITMLRHEKGDSRLHEARKQYLEVLQSFPSSVFAANGLASVEAEYGHLQQAKAALDVIRDGAPDVGCIIINQAHCLAALGKFDQAEPLYKRALAAATTPAQRKELMLCLARVKFDFTRKVDANNSDLALGAFSACITWLEKCTVAYPQDTTLWYNLALTLSDAGILMFRVAAEERTYRQLVQGLQRLARAQRIASWLSDGVADDSGKVPYDVATMKRISDSIRSGWPQYEEHLAHQKQSDEFRASSSSRLAAEMERREQERQELIRKERETEQAAIRDRQLAAERLLQETEEKKAGWLAQQAARAASDKRSADSADRAKRNKKAEKALQDAFVEDNEDEEQDDDEDAGPAAKSKKARKAADSQEAEEDAEQAVVADLFGISSDEDEDEDSKQPADTVASRGTKRRNRVDSDEEANGNAEAVDPDAAGNGDGAADEVEEEEEEEEVASSPKRQRTDDEEAVQEDSDAE